MSPPRHREANAKVEGRNPLEETKGTLTPFRVFMTRLLNVPMSEVYEQQKLYDKDRAFEKLKSSKLDSVPVKRKRRSLGKHLLNPSPNQNASDKEQA